MASRTRSRIHRIAGIVSVSTALAATFATMNLVAGGNRDAAADQSASIGVASTVKIGPDGRFVTTRFAHYHVGSEVSPVDDAAIGFGDAKPDPAPGQVHDYVGHEVLATSNQIGAAWGVAATTGNPGAPAAEARGARTFYGAYLKADTRFGPGGPGAVYVRSASGAVSEFVRIADAGGTADQLAGLHTPAWPDPQPDVGKRGLGDVEIDTKERFLYVVNLFDRTVYRVDTWASAPASTLGRLSRPPFAGTCADDSDWHPFGLHVTTAALYLGAMCSAESTGDARDARGQVWAYDLVTGTWSAAPVMAANGWPGAGFHAWSDDTSVNTADLQMMLSGIDIAPDGSMVLGFRARHGDMISTNEADGKRSGNGMLTIARSIGDGQWGDPADTDPYAGQNGPSWLPPSPPYFDVLGVDKGGFAAEGAVVTIPKVDAVGMGWEVAATQRDVFNTAGKGVRWFDASGGESTGGEEIYRYGQPRVFGKAHGLGDLESLTTWRVIGDRVWNDTNGDGVQDQVEPGIKSVLLQLRATCSSTENLATALTATDGSYRFIVEPFATYAIVAAKEAFAIGGPLHGLVHSPEVSNRPTVDSNADISTGCVSVAAGEREEVNLTYDIGVRRAPQPKFAVGDRVWSDVDRNGVQDTGEPGVGGVTVELLAGPKMISSTTTSAAGWYVFDRLDGGSYSVRFSNIPAGFVFSAGGQGTAATDSNADVVTGMTAVFQLDGTTPSIAPADLVDLPGVTATRIDRSIDAGIHQPAPPPDERKFAVGDFVWSDTNRDGIQDDTEPGIGGVTVELRSGSVVIDSTVTSGTGWYVFDHVRAGEYSVRFSNLPVGFQFSPAGQGSVDKDSNADQDSGKTAVFTLGPDTPGVTPENLVDFPGLYASWIDRTIDAGINQPPPPPADVFSIGNRVWSDLNDNGLLDAGEQGIKGVEVILLDPERSAMIRTVTSNGGYYRFDGLSAGGYVVSVAAVNFGLGGPLAGFTSSKVDEADPNVDVDSNDNGLGIKPSPGVSSAPVTLGFSDGTGEPTGEGDVAGPGQGADDDKANMTVDFGFRPPFDLGITKTVRNPDLTKAAKARYSITVLNDSPYPVGDVTVSDPAPQGMTFESVSAPAWACQVAASVVTCTRSAVFAPGERSTIEVVGVVTMDNGSLTNTACVSTPVGGGQNGANDCGSAKAIVITGVLPKTGGGLIPPMVLWAQALAALGAWMTTSSRRRAVR